LTPHIISGDELITGSSLDFERRDKQYQDYKNFSEQQNDLQLKNYQGYPALKADKEVMPDLKPLKSF
jgi:hypothetical protein